MEEDRKAPCEIEQRAPDHDVWIRTLVDSIEDYAIFLLDTDGTVCTWNPGAQRIKCYKAEEIIGRHFSTFYTDEDRAAGKPARKLEQATRTGRAEDEGWRVRKDGSRFWASVVITALRDERGELIGFGKVTRDLSERRAADQELQRTLNELQVSHRELDEYAGFVAHDLQEPLRKMASFAELLEDRYGPQLDAQAREYIGYVVSGAHRLRKLVTGVLEYARIGKGELPMERIALETVMAEVRDDLEPALREAGGTLEVGPLPVVTGHPTRLAIVLRNLVSNGLKYRDPGRPVKVWVTARRVGPEWVISVTDNGIGFDPVHAERIMRPFQRLHSKERFDGSGLGLASARKVVGLHGGQMWATSRPGSGSTFSFSLPVTE